MPQLSPMSWFFVFIGFFTFFVLVVVITWWGGVGEYGILASGMDTVIKKPLYWKFSKCEKLNFSVSGTSKVAEVSKS